MKSVSKRRKVQVLKSKLGLMNGRLERDLQVWVIVRWWMDSRLNAEFVKKQYATRIGGHTFVMNITAAQTWHSYAAARKYLMSKPGLRGCEVLNFTRLERLQEESREAQQKHGPIIDRTGRFLGDDVPGKYSNPQR